MSTRRHVAFRAVSVWTAAIVTAIPAISTPHTGLAEPAAVVGGYDHFAGPLGQTTDGAVAAVVMGLGRGDVTIAGVGFDDSFIGRGVSMTGAAGISAWPAVTMRIAGTRYLAEGSFRAWRAKAGPQIALPGGRSLTLSYTHYRDVTGVRSDGAVAEAATPLTTSVLGRASASVASAPLGPAALQGSLGVAWNMVSHLELSCEAGLARNAAGAAGQPFPARGPLDGLPLVGGGSSPPSSSPEITRHVDGTLLVGVRVTVP